MPTPECIIFDCDGILVDSEQITFSVLSEMSREIGVILTETELEHHFLGKSLNSIIRFLGEETGKNLADTFESEFRQRTFDRFKTDLQPVDGISALLDRIRVPVCVASSGPPAKIKMNLALTGLTNYFGDKVFSCYDLKRWKPDPAIFRHAAQTMGYRPGQCVVIEDSPTGVRGAIAGGFRTYALSRHGNEQLLADAGATVYHHHRELYDLLFAEG
ncbi:HAD family hydrolase [Neolewinella agarilytica]|uniref:Haloacid dehalogenase superfamily, subfamily IA, variant 3 with third motif having DD or ED n=1 Tax=Neolewinella agarilytica TaxID=478744 RepID=A0A1H9FC98_9BACT|nr:HAD family hydrolase [Neolewinella agarilytica]SEQ35560.1 haloacid dehalogenase superfamily, subfamily IA, variant 3 with third motif having DD or ED [Neolewinella agarilytica]